VDAPGLSLDLRADRRWTIRGTQLIAYLDVQNANARRNVSAYQWDARTRTVEPVEFLVILPSIGVNWEF
jgi:hypothetical protein